jgi:hypothetical protein
MVDMNGVEIEIGQLLHGYEYGELIKAIVVDIEGSDVLLLNVENDRQFRVDECFIECNYEVVVL